VLAFALANLEQVERQLRERLDALGPAPRAELLHVLMLPDFDRADRIGEFWGHPETRTFGELLIDLEEDKAARAVVFGLLAEMERKGVGIVPEVRWGSSSGTTGTKSPQSP